MSNSNLIFGSKTDLVLAATPSLGGFLVAYDSATGFLSQKNDQGVISRIGIAPTASGVLETFLSDIQVSLNTGKSFGKYINGDIVPANGKSAVEVIIEALSEPIGPSISLDSISTILFNQTSVSNVLTYTYSINTIGATVSSTLLEWRRNNFGSWVTLSTDINISTFTHSFTDTSFNTQPFNYRYTVTDSSNAVSTALKNITPGIYITPSVSFNLIAATLSSFETNIRRENGNIESNLSGTITRNSSQVSLSNYQLQYQKNNSGSWVNIGATVSISGATPSIPITNHNDIINLSNATTIGYRALVTDLYTTITSPVFSINLPNVIFYGAFPTIPSSSSDVRSLSNKIFTNVSNPFNLNTGTTYSNFTVALPSTINVTEVIDLETLNLDVTYLYILNTFNVLNFIGTNISYNVYTMTNAIPYNLNHRHRITTT